jgi:hypothetical protein
VHGQVQAIGSNGVRFTECTWRLVIMVLGSLNVHGDW